MEYNTSRVSTLDQVFNFKNAENNTSNTCIALVAAVVVLMVLVCVCIGLRTRFKNTGEDILQTVSLK